MNIENLKRRLNRLEEQRDKLEKEHKGNETKYTYWGGYELGYLRGKISEIENIIDLYNESESDKSSYTETSLSGEKYVYVDKQVLIQTIEEEKEKMGISYDGTYDQLLNSLNNIY